MAVPIPGPSQTLSSPSTPPISLDMNGSLPDFAQPYEYKCDLCQNLLLDPMQTKCGHRLCRKCVEKHLSVNGDPAMCPFEEEDCEYISLKAKDGSIFPDFYLIKELKKIKVYCPYRDKGCPEMVPWGKLNQHEENCEYGRTVCPNASLGCKVKPKIALLNEHLKECEYVPLACQFCERQDIPQLLMKVHLEEDCPNIEIECPYRCGNRFYRGELSQHEINCPNTPKSCQYSSAGCSFKGSEDDVIFHERSELENHLKLVFSYSKSLESRAEEREKVFQEKDKQLKKLESSVKAYEQMANKHDKLIKGTQAMIADHEDLLQEQTQTLTNHTNQISTLESNRQQGVNDEARRRLEQITARLSQMDLRFQVLETASYDGVLLWKIRDYSRRKEEARTGGILSLYSQAFYTSRHGYRMCARVYLNGDGMGQGTHLSLFFVVMRGEYDALLKWPFRQRVSLMLLDQVTGQRNMVDTFRPDPSSSSFQKPVNDMNVASGCPLFVSHTVLEGSDSVYLKDETIFIKIVVDTSDLTH